MRESVVTIINGLLIKIVEGFSSAESVVREVDRVAWLNGLSDNGVFGSCDDACSSILREPVK